MRKRRHSLAGRLLFLFVVTAVLLVLVVRTGFRIATDLHMGHMAAPHLAEYVQHLLDELGSPPTIARAEALAARLPLRIELRGGINWRSDGEGVRFARKRAVARHLANGGVFQVNRGRGNFAVLAELNGVTVLLAPTRFELAQSGGWVALATIVVLLLILLGAYHAIRRLFRPVESIQSGIARIGEGDLAYRLDIRRRDELGALADSVNTMANDIGLMLEAKRELLLAISHELRSPLTRAGVHASLLENDQTGDAIRADLAEVESLLHELLESERLSGKHAALNRKAIDPSVLLRDLVEEGFADREVELELDPPGTWLSIDPVRIRVLVRNLLQNALRHTPEGRRRPRLASHVGDTAWCLTVIDFGEGIAEQHLARLAEPFYRADRSRQRDSGGVGLGLYLGRIIAEAHGGELAFHSQPGKGTTVVFEMPLAA